MVALNSTSRSRPTDKAFLDSTKTLSQDFSHLSVDYADLSVRNIDLSHISPKCDTLTEDDHKVLDEEILTMFDANRQHNEEPDLSTLLSNITHYDGRLVALTTSEAENLLKNQLLMKTALKDAWRRGAFREVRQLGALIGIIWTCSQSSPHCQKFSGHHKPG